MINFLSVNEPTKEVAVSPSPEGKFIVEYLGTAMMDSRCSYSSQMMPWVIAEILRFSEPDQVVLGVKDSRLTCTSLNDGKTIFDSHVSDCLHIFPVITAGGDSPPPVPPQRSLSPFRSYHQSHNQGNHNEERKCFVTIIRANDIYLHCRLFAASSGAQVTEVFSTMKESSKMSYGSSAVGVGVSNNGIGGPIRSSSTSKVTDLATTISADSISFEVLYVGKLRMSYRKAPISFVDEALDKFKSHENEKIIQERRDSIVDSHSRRSSSQESSSDQGGSLESLAFQKPTINVISSPSDEQGGSIFPSLSEKANVPNSSVDFQKDTSPLRFLPDIKEKEAIVKSSIPHPLEDVTYNAQSQRSRNPSGDACLVKSMSLPVEPMRSRALSTGHYPRNQVLETNRIGSSHYNRTMILIVGRCEMKIISPDAKTLLFSKHFREIYQSSQGIQNKEYFGFICREAQSATGGSSSSSTGGHHHGGGYVAYVFRCQSESVSGDILKVLKQASVVTQENLKKERQISSCDHCPMIWYRQLCAEIDGLTCDDRIQIVILKHINGLLDEDRQSIMAKFHGAEPQSVQEQNELLMMLLRVYCESKQVKHIHDTTENRHEFLHQYLGGGAILMKAKRSITNSFDQFIKRKSRDGGSPHPGREFSLPSLPHHLLQSSYGKEINGSPLLGGGGGQTGGNSSSHSSIDSPGEGEEGRRGIAEETEACSMVVSDSPLDSTPQHRPRSSTLGALSGEKIRYEIRNRRTSQATPLSPGQLPTTPNRASTDSNNYASGSPTTSFQKNSPMMNLFQKVGSQSKPAPQSSTSIRRSGSWRHAIFKKVVSPSPPTSVSGPSRAYNQQHPSTPASSRTFRPKKTQKEIRELWKTAINQQIILIRMEKQNIRLRAKQQEADVKRVKLSYKDLGICDEEANDTWDLIISQSQMNSSTKCDIQLLNSALLRGIPKHKRGQIWQFFIQQRTMGKDPNYSNLCHLKLQTPYEQLLRQLTSQQHAILIDLGRTFPTHPYFSSALGSGQLALFNILKAYSLLDTDVGYCQGLSFVAGLLLMHLEEEEAFSVLKYIMFDLRAREHYKPDMHELQVKLYQLTRLIHDQDPDLLLLLNHYDVLPSLYAAPWFLTLFASQFSVGFAVRVLDVLLLHGVDVIAKFALVIILDHKKQLMQCTGLEQVMECFKAVVTNISSEKLDRYLRKVLESDWDKQMLTYAVEYSVMNDEAFHAFLSESSGTQQQQGTSGNGKIKAQSDKCVQTEPKKSESPTPSLSGEKHPILGDLIQRQNSEISKLKQEKADLRKDVQSLLNCMVAMQKLAQISSGGRIPLPVPPEVTSIASKYFMKCGKSFAGALENGWSPSQNHGGDIGGSAGLNSTDYDDKFKRNSLPTSTDERQSDFNGPSDPKRVTRSIDYGSSLGIPTLDPDSSDDSSDAGSHPSSVDSPTDSTTTSTTNVQSSLSVSKKFNMIM